MLIVHSFDREMEIVLLHLRCLTNFWPHANTILDEEGMTKVTQGVTVVTRGTRTSGDVQNFNANPKSKVGAGFDGRNPQESAIVEESAEETSQQEDSATPDDEENNSEDNESNNSNDDEGGESEPSEDEESKVEKSKSVEEDEGKLEETKVNSIFYF